MKTLSRPLLISALANCLFLIWGIYYIHHMGGIRYIKKMIGPASPTSDPYYDVRNSLFTLLAQQSGNHHDEILFLGDSLTDYCDWYELLDNTRIRNRGIAGDYVEGVNRRLDEALKSQPRKIFLMIGINNVIVMHNTKNDVLKSYRTLLQAIKTKSPSSRVYVESLLPVAGGLRKNNELIVSINKDLALLAGKFKYQYVNLHDSFLNPQGELDTIYTSDGLHLNGSGYLVWRDHIKDFVSE